jgi:hypothetical protein
MAEASRKLFSVSRISKKSVNDSHRVRQLLQKYGLNFEDKPNFRKEARSQGTTTYDFNYAPPYGYTDNE